MAVHASDTGHRIDLENVEVLRRGLRFTPQRLVTEAVEITTLHNVNRIEGVELASVWKAVLDKPSRHVTRRHSGRPTTGVKIYQQNLIDPLVVSKKMDSSKSLQTHVWKF
ncbi:hypothetical protein T265_03757 [Opisthorchis viverrini]|uniref:Uncharacterized protein n=1 Tax=Opisthorchis viverrini TaxID=6198 RepID=A0A074ZQI9_OPIVI|nr:hypothetical protein T265_03757 [Opisthorchis viverrini]KER29648.1 hypothetical protein T265_03757 [Opisthorchis viverrini]